MILEGTILHGRSFEPIEGRVVIEAGQITAVEEEAVDGNDIVMPAFVNAHTHVGDSIAKEAGAGLDLDELVAPPDGLKHRLLRTAVRDSLVDAMVHSLRFMAATGTAAFIDFREGGVDGVSALEEAGKGLDIEPIILGREGVEAMERGDGFGASGAADGEFGSERTATLNAGKLFGIHAGEVDAGDINPALDLEPDFLVHLVNAEPVHLERIGDSEIPVVVCPRSNLTTGVGLPPVNSLVERTTVALGTDNVMLNSPSMFREMEFAAKLTDVPDETVLGMATTAGAEIAGLNGGVVEAGRDAKLIVLDGGSDNLAGVTNVVRAVVRRADPADITQVLL